MTNLIPQNKPPKDNTLTPPKDLLIKLALVVKEANPEGQPELLELLDDAQVMEWLQAMRQKGLIK